MDNRYVRSINIVTGIDDGTIRYYINGDQSTSENIYIRGLNDLPYISYNNPRIPILTEKNIAISFHPELTENTLIHEYFIKNIL